MSTDTAVSVPYEQFVADKVAFDEQRGFTVPADSIHPILLPHQRDLVRWAVAGGRRAIFAAFGLGKTVMQLETLRLTLEQVNPHAAAGLIVCPLGVRQEFIHDARMLGMDVRFIRHTAEFDGPGIYLTNYESVRDGRLDPGIFDAVSLDEASVLRSFGSKTYQTFLTLFDGVPYRFLATATPSPNRYKELIHYAGYLGIMDTGQALTRFFQRDSTKANNLTLYPHKMVEFFLWLNTWAAFVQEPSDLCRCQCHRSPANSKVSGSAALLPSNGSRGLSAPAAGSVGATAAASSPRDQASCSPDAPGVADVSGRHTEAREAALTQSGAAWSTGAPTQSTRTGATTEAGESPCANDGAHRSPHSAKTWGNPPSDSPLSALTTAGDMSLETVDGPVARSKRATLAEPDSSHSTAENSRSQHGPKSSERTTSPSTPASSNSDGLPNAHSLTSCSGTCDEGYDLPPLAVEWHNVDVDHSLAGEERDGQGLLYRGGALSLVDASREKRRTLPERVAALMDIVRDHHAADPDDQIVLWCDLNDEQTAIEKALANEGLTYSSIHGGNDLDENETRMAAWRNRETYALIGKPVMLGQGVNLQQANTAVFVGITHKFNDLIQACHRIQRFGQTRPCVAHIIHADSETEIKRELLAKWTRHKELTATMTTIICEHGLNPEAIHEQLQRAIGVERVSVSGESWELANNDCVLEVRDHMEADSVGLIVTSIPFANHYEYTPSYNDFGHTDDNAHFWAQMDYLTPELLRVLQPGRIYACHVKDRINFGGQHGTGLPTVSPFHVEAIQHARKHGFDYLGMITVVTDVVRENNQTYRLSYSKMLKDGTTMGVGSPEYVLLFHKPQTDRSKGFADLPVTKDRDGYSLPRWQLDASAFWRSSGDRPLTAAELAALPMSDRIRALKHASIEQVYDHEAYVNIGDQLDASGVLPRTFTGLPVESADPQVWTDVDRMRINGEQVRRNVQMHVCPLQFDIVERLIDRYSNPDDLVFDPFGGLGTVPLTAVRRDRRGRAVELNAGYWSDAVRYLREHDENRALPTLFDLLDDGAA